MAETTVGQIDSYYKLMSKYFEDTGAYYQSPSSEAPLFMELLGDINYTQVLTESQNKAKANPTMISGALIEVTSAMFATLREAGLRAKTRSDFWAESESSTSRDSQHYLETGQLMISFVNGSNNAQN